MMTDTGLNRRLNQHSRRSGFAVAFTMVLAAGLMIVAFIGLFAWLNPFLSDFISETGGGNGGREIAAETATDANPSVPPSAAPSVAPSPSPPPAEPTQPAEAQSAGNEAVDPAPDFVADYQSSPDNPINLRSDPGTNGTQILEILQPGTPLQSVGQEEVVNGVTWIQFRTENGLTGWIREIDAVPLGG